MAEWLNSPTIVIAVLAAVGLIFGVGKWVGGVNSDRKGLKENADRDRSELKDIIREIRDDIKRIFERLPSPATAGGRSPLSLNELGKEVARELGAEQWASEVAPGLLNDMKGKKPFEIDEFCANHASSNLSPEWELKVAECAYQFGINRGSVRTVLHITLRDELIRLLGEHPSQRP